MKVICIGRNYVEHASELNNPIPENPLIFMKPPSALLVNDKPFYYPEFTEDLHYEGEIVIKISKNGKYVQPKFARTYYNQIAFGLDLTARDLQNKCKAKGHPWEISKGFDNAAPISNFINIGTKDVNNISFETHLNGEIVQKGNTSDLIFDFDFLICYVSRYFKLQQGDMIFTGTPAGVGPLKIGDVLEGYIEGKKMLRCEIR